MAEKNNEKIIKIPEKSEKLAEFVGIVLGDGCISKYIKKNHYHYYAVRIVGDSRHDRDYFLNFVKPLIKELFGIDASVYYRKEANTMDLHARSKQLIYFLLSIGMKDGNKIKNQVGFPKWIWEKEEYVAACLRGLIDTDGCICELLPHWPGLWQLNFDNRSLPLLQDVRRAFLKLGFHPSKIHGSKTPYGNRVDITRKADIHKFYKEICFHNSRHLKRYEPVTAP